MILVSLVFWKPLEPRVGSGFFFFKCNIQTVSLHAFDRCVWSVWPALAALLRLATLHGLVFVLVNIAGT